MNIYNSSKILIISLSLLLLTSVTNAAPVEFVPPNDPIGNVFTINSNDGWSNSRGIGFQVNSVGKSINSVGVWHDLTNVSLSYGVHEIDSSTGSFTRTATLRSGSSVISTNGLEWIDFGFADLALDMTKTYLLDFSFADDANQNFFYNNVNVPWSQDGFQALEGTQSSSFSNSVVAAFRVNDVRDVPEPTTLALLSLGLFGLGFSKRKKV